MMQNDFKQLLLEASDWFPFDDKRVQATRATYHWLPVSFRARVWFRITSFYGRDKTLSRMVTEIFGVHALHLSFVNCDNSDYFKVASRVKSVEKLCLALDAMELLFAWGNERGYFKNVMYKDPSSHDFWAYLDCVNGEDDGVKRRKFILHFLNAYEKTLLSNKIAWLVNEIIPIAFSEMSQ